MSRYCVESTHPPPSIHQWECFNADNWPITSLETVISSHPKHCVELWVARIRSWPKLCNLALRMHVAIVSRPGIGQLSAFKLFYWLGWESNLDLILRDQDLQAARQTGYYCYLSLTWKLEMDKQGLMHRRLYFWVTMLGIGVKYKTRHSDDTNLIIVSNKR